MSKEICLVLKETYNSVKRDLLNRDLKLDAHCQVICLDEIKMNLLGKSCICPGFSTVVCNLMIRYFRSLSSRSLLTIFRSLLTLF